MKDPMGDIDDAASLPQVPGVMVAPAPPKLDSIDLCEHGGINSAQMGLRLEHVGCWPCLDYVYERTATGDCTNLNAPTSTMMTSHSYVIPQDHIDIIGVGPDTFDEMEFYAALTDYIADSGF